ncbi:MAG: DUF853 family protein [Chloroflexi bacterium]|nr:DUF853 family protein [Chloroflexota bacterium]
MAAGYSLGEPSIVIGGPMHDGQVASDVRVQLALSMVSRHGLIAGATGTGKTKTLQVLAGQLSAAGVPVFAADVKTDLSGIAQPGDAADERVRQRAASLAWTFEPRGHPTELLSLTGALGTQVRASVHSFGPLLLGKVLDLNETQTSILGLVFKYCDDNDLPLLDLADLRTTLRFLSSEEGKPVLEEYGGMSKASVGVLVRAITMLEQDGSDIFFGEPEFDVADLMRTSADGRAIVSLLEISDVMERPRLVSTFMLWLLAQLYATLPEAGDLPKPKLCFFFDEAHLLFDDASEALMEQVERTVRLIRSKGVGVYFVTHAPTDVPSEVLSQLSNRVQHAIRAYTPDDADDLRKTARTFPISDFYDVEEVIRSLGIGEALVTVLSPQGVPTPLAATRIVPPDSRMAPLSAQEYEQLRASGALAPKYGQTVDRESAHEIITRRLAGAKAAATEASTGTPGAGPVSDGALERSIVGGDPTTAREAARHKRELERVQREAERERKAELRRLAAEERARQREREQMMRTGGQVLRTVFGTLFGTRRRR